MIDFLNIHLLRQQSDLCVAQWLEAVLKVEWKLNNSSLISRLETFVTLFAGLTLRGRDGRFEMASVLCVVLPRRYNRFSILYPEIFFYCSK